MTEKCPAKFGFYGILTNPVRGYDYLTNVLVAEKIAFIQLRMKDVSPDIVEKTAESMKKITDNTHTRLIINDDPVLAKKAAADGVHIGQSDMPFKEARELLGDGTIIGLSTHSPRQTIAAQALSPDYIGIGPVFPTPTKKNPDPVIGISGMSRMLSLSTVPAVAIGGITLETLPAVLTGGAVNFCMVRPLNQALNPEKVLKAIMKVYSDFISGASTTRPALFPA